MSRIFRPDRQNSPVEPFEESLNLILDRVIKTVRYNQSNVFRFVLLRHWDTCATFFQFDYFLLTELVIFDRELLLQIRLSADESQLERDTYINDTGYIIVKHPLQGLVVPDDHQCKLALSRVTNSGSTLSKSRISTVRPRICL
jgi:hypothetical protein